MKKLLKNLFKNSLQKGFTLIELLVVIAVIGVLAAIVLLAVNPGEQLARARDTNRQSAVTQLGRALQGYYTAQGAVYPAEGQTAPIWTTKLTDSGDLKTVPANPTYSVPPIAPVCTYASYAIGAVVTGYCYRATASDAIVYVKLEATLSKNKCAVAPLEQAFWVFSTADARAGGVCRTVAQGEPVVAPQTFTF